MVCTANFNKRCLLGINFAYIIAAIILIGVASYAKHANIANTVPIVGGIIACGVFLLFVAVLGLIATLRQSQSLIFYYMIILSIIFILQFFISIACLGVKHETESDLVLSAWDAIDNPNNPGEIHSIEQQFGCCGVNTEGYRRQGSNYADNGTCIGDWCGEINYCISKVNGCNEPNKTATPLDFGCPTCDQELDKILDKAFNSTGGLGLFFSFCELFAILTAFVYRKQCANLTTIT